MQHPLHKFMSENGLKRKDIADHFGRSPQCIGKWLDGKTSPSTEDFIKFRKHWGREPSNKLVTDWIDWLEYKRGK